MNYHYTSQLSALHPLCVHRPSPQQYPDPPQNMPFMEFMRSIIRWLFRPFRAFRVDRVLPLSVVSFRLFLVVYLSAYFPGEMKVDSLRMLVPPNGRGVVERRWIDDRGNPESYRITTWRGVSPPPLLGAGGLGGRDKH